MSEDRSVALYDTSKQPVIQKAAPVAHRGMRRWAACGACMLCLATLAALLLVYALVPLPGWEALLIGVLIVLLFLGMIAALGLTVEVVTPREPEAWT